MPTGSVTSFAGSSAPSGWLLCDGRSTGISRTTYANLFAVIGTTYGSGDGSTTFNLPDLRGRVVGGKDDMGGTAASRITNAVSGITATTLGATGGNQNLHQHSHPNTASFSGSGANTGTVSSDHSHYYNEPYNTSGMGPAGSYGYFFYSRGANTGGISANHTHGFTPSGTVTVSNANQGSGASQNVQPTIILNYIIKA
jgi:microcystin-dependent protein